MTLAGIVERKECPVIGLEPVIAGAAAFMNIVIASGSSGTISRLRR
jgi:hypothetical protein